MGRYPVIRKSCIPAHFKSLFSKEFLSETPPGDRLFQIFGQETNQRNLTARLSLGLNYSLFDLNKSNWNNNNLSDTLLDLTLKQGSGFQVGYGFIQKINENVNLVCEQDFLLAIKELNQTRL